MTTKITGSVNWTLAHKLVKNKSEQVLTEFSKLMKQRVEERTPVGDPLLWQYPAPLNYIPGTLKASWEIVKTPDSFALKNDQPYAQRVEYGWSSQAPNGMLRLTIKDSPELLKQASKKVKKL